MFMMSFVYLLTSAFAEGDVQLAPNHQKVPTVSVPNLDSTTTTSTDKDHVKARLLSDHQQVTPGQTYRIGVHLEQEEGWHTYWKSPGTIGKPTFIEWHLPEKFVATNHQFPIPVRFDQSEIVSFGYEDQVLLYSDITVPSDVAPNTYQFSADVEWLMCKESCIPGKATVHLELPVGTEAVISPYAPLFDHSQSQLPTPILSVASIGVESILQPSTVLANADFQLEITIHSTTDTPLQIPENLEKTWPLFTPIVGDWWMQNTQEISKTPEGNLQIRIQGTAFEPEEYPTQDVIGGLLQIQQGAEWIQTEIVVPLSIQNPTTATNTPSSTNTTIETTNSPTNTLASSNPPADMGMIQALLLAFFGGMLLNIMPCVLPVLTLKLFGLIEQTGITAKEQRIAGIAYTAGIVLSFVLLAVVVIVLQNSLGLDVGWGFQFQYPEYVIALASIVFVFGLSLLGVFEIPVIGAQQADNLSQKASKSAWLEYCMLGVFATLLATPCSAPFLGTGIGFAFTLPPMGILLFFSIAGLGLASPFLLVAFIPSFFKILPKPGAWMETFKQIMGFTLMATTIWLIDVLGAQTGQEGITGFLIFSLFLGVSSWIFGKWGSVLATGMEQLRAFIIAVVVSSVGGYFFLHTEFAKTPQATNLEDIAALDALDFSTEIPWQPFSDANIDTLRSANKAIFIDFTADWCLSCKVNEKNVLNSEVVRQGMQQHNVIPVKADWTRRDESISAWLKRYGKAGVPFYLFISKDGTITALPEVLTTEMVLEAISK